MLRSALGAAVLVASLASAADATYCPRPLHRATRLVIITVPDMGSTKATMHTFERKTPADAGWLRSGPPEEAAVGAAGIGWSPTYLGWAKKDEAVKREGDKKTPAGIFRLGPTFGLGAEKIKDHLQLQPGRNFCVEDPASLMYGKIVSPTLMRGVKVSEDMATVPAYKRGLVVNYPALRGAKAGSCVFVHVWDRESIGVGLPEERVAVLQRWAGTGFTAIAILAEDQVDRFKSCLPLNDASAKAQPTADVPEPHPRRGHKDQRADLGR